MELMIHSLVFRLFVGTGAYAAAATASTGDAAGLTVQTLPASTLAGLVFALLFLIVVRLLTNSGDTARTGMCHGRLAIRR